MKRLLITTAILAASFAANADGYTNVTYSVNGTNYTVRARKIMPNLVALMKEHGERIGIEKDPISSTITWVFADGHRESRKFPKKLIDNPMLFSAVNMSRIRKFEAMKKNEEERK